MSEFKIEDGIPLPPNSRGAGYCKYPFAEMKVGESFLIAMPGATSQQRSSRASNVNATIRVFKQRDKTGKDKEFTRRAVDEGVRVWRVK